MRVLLTVCIVMLRPAKLVETVTIMRKRKRTERQREGESERVREGGRERERERERLYLEQCQCEINIDMVHDASLRLSNEHVRQGMPSHGWNAVEGLIQQSAGI